jgi:transposase
MKNATTSSAQGGPIQFRTKALTAGKTTTGIQIPDDVIEQLGGGERPAIRVPINGYTYRSTDVSRFRSVKQAISYCGLCGDEKSSAGKVRRTPLSKQRNKHIQRVLVEAAKLAPKQSHACQ